MEDRFHTGNNEIEGSAKKCLNPRCQDLREPLERNSGFYGARIVYLKHIIKGHNGLDIKYGLQVCPR